MVRDVARGRPADPMRATHEIAWRIAPADRPHRAIGEIQLAANGLYRPRPYRPTRIDTSPARRFQDILERLAATQTDTTN